MTADLRRYEIDLCFSVFVSHETNVFQIAAEVAAPLKKTEEIVLINDDNGNKVSSEVTKLLGQLPPSVKALTGVDLSKVSSYMQGNVLNCLQSEYTRGVSRNLENILDGELSNKS